MAFKLWWAGAAIAALAGPVVAMAADCDTLRPSVPAAGTTRPVTADDLLRLRDIGPPGELAGLPGNLGVSPDHKHVAVVLRQADPDQNRHCTGLFVVPLDGVGQVRFLGSAGEPLYASINFWGIPDYPSGATVPITPKWSPDGKKIAIRVREAGRIQVRVIEVESGIGQTVGDGRGDIVEFAWSETGEALILQVRVDRGKGPAQIEAEASQGFRYDDRFMPTAGPRPFSLEPPRFDWVEVDMASGKTRAASGPEKDRVAHFGAVSPGISLDWEGLTGSRARLRLINQDGTEVECQAETCRTGVTAAWKIGEGDVAFTRREGWADEAVALYRWRPQKSPVRVWQTTDLVTDCQRVASELLCLAEGSVQPRRIEAFDLSRDRRRVVFDPNPEVHSLRWAPAERLRWQNAQGLQVLGDLVMPPNRAPGTRVPLIVVQYTTRGFLRGGTGDEYPIQAFASAGFAVLSFQRPADISTLSSASSFDELIAASFHDWADRKSVHSALMAGLDKVLARGEIDDKRLGITGLSDGTSTVQYALINSERFAAAALSTCCQDPKTQMLVSGPLTAKAFQRFGFPKASDAAEDFWKPYSLALNAHHLRTPLQMQVSDDEYLASLETYTAFMEAGIPAELYVFPNERHIKWQPAHRAAIYKRNLDWFRRWLMPSQGQGEGTSP